MTLITNRVSSLGPNTLHLPRLGLSNGLPSDENIRVAWAILQHTFHNQGGTFDETGTPVPVDGYAVGGFVDGLKLDVTDPTYDNDLKIASFLHRIPRNGDGEKAAYVGTWIEDGILYVDATQIHNDQEEAYFVARERGEIAIYDGFNDVSYDVEGYFEAVARDAEQAEARDAARFAPDAEDVKPREWVEYIDPHNGLGYGDNT
jgi:hypothetical protein